MSLRTVRDWARAYASIGWRVYPVVRGGKRPLYDGWIADATTDPGLIDRWWRDGSGAPNIGVIAGETFDVVDVEVDHLAAFRAAVRVHGLPPAPMARSGRGGLHVYVVPLGLGTRSLVLDDIHIGELKGSGGVVAPPSATVGRYARVRSPLVTPLPLAPDWLRGLTVGPTATHAASCGRTMPSHERLTPSRAVAIAHGLFRVVSEAPEGDRNSMLFWAACRAAEHGLEPAATAEILLAAAVRAGLPEREAKATIESGLGR